VRLHFYEPHRNTAFGKLPRCFAACQTSTDDGYLHRFSWFRAVGRAGKQAGRADPLPVRTRPGIPATSAVHRADRRKRRGSFFVGNSLRRVLACPRLGRSKHYRRRGAPFGTTGQFTALFYSPLRASSAETPGQRHGLNSRRRSARERRSHCYLRYCALVSQVIMVEALGKGASGVTKCN